MRKAVMSTRARSHSVSRAVRPSASWPATSVCGTATRISPTHRAALKRMVSTHLLLLQGLEHDVGERHHRHQQRARAATKNKRNLRPSTSSTEAGDQRESPPRAPGTARVVELGRELAARVPDGKELEQHVRDGVVLAVARALREHGLDGRQEQLVRLAVLALRLLHLGASQSKLRAVQTANNDIEHQQNEGRERLLPILPRERRRRHAGWHAARWRTAWPPETAREQSAGSDTKSTIGFDKWQAGIRTCACDAVSNCRPASADVLLASAAAATRILPANAKGRK